MLDEKGRKAASSINDREETILPSQNQDPPINLEQALSLVEGSTYTYRALYIISNLLSLTGFMLFFSLAFMFQEPKLECFNEDVSMKFRCSPVQACGQYKNHFNIIGSASFSFISHFHAMCDA